MKKFSFGELKIMVNKINIGIVGYGNLGRAVEKALMNNDDLKLEAIFTRRNTKNIISNSKLLHISEMKNYIGSIDVMILCGGSATDLPQQSAEIAKYFNLKLVIFFRKQHIISSVKITDFLFCKKN